MANVCEKLRDMGDQAPRVYLINSGAGAGAQNLVLGGGAQNRIWAVPGVSNFFVGASMPYAAEATDETLGFKPERYVSVDTAIDLAQTAYMRAWVPGRKAIGLGLTCSVASTHVHRGGHRLVMALVDESDCWVVDTVIPKGEGQDQRKLDGARADGLVFLVLDEYISGFNNRDAYPIMDGVSVVRMNNLACARVHAHPLFRADGSRVASWDVSRELVPDETVFFPGSFNPPHDGHFKGAVAAMSFAGGRQLVFSTTTYPLHKTPLSTSEMLQRAKLMRGHDFLLSGYDPLFLDKARRFPGAFFVVGADTMDRFLDPQWGPAIEPMLSEFMSLGTKFLVLGRQVKGNYVTADDIAAKRLSQGSKFMELFTAVQFRLDLSSSDIRVGKDLPSKPTETEIVCWNY